MIEHWPAPPCESAFHGPLGRAARLMEPHSEAPVAFLLVNLLASFGALIGRTAHFTAGARPHHPNLFAVLVGPTGAGQKGSSWDPVAHLFRLVDAGFDDLVRGGLASGEGLIYHVRDAVEKVGKKDGQLIEEIVDEGVSDKRLLVLETELGRVLKAMRREGNTLSALLRQAWDGDRLATMTRRDPLTATGAHVSVVAHITPEELARELGEGEAFNGFSNRFLWVCGRRSKRLPHGGDFLSVELTALAQEIRETLRLAQQREELRRDAAANELWEDVYAQLTDENRPGLYGATVGRAAPQVMRLALIYALADKLQEIQRVHLEAALAVWAACDEAASALFGRATGNATADKIDRALDEAGETGMTRTEIRDLLQRHKKEAAIDVALDLLEKLGRAFYEMEPSDGGRNIERWYSTRHKRPKRHKGVDEDVQPDSDDPSVAYVASVATQEGRNGTAHEALLADPGALSLDQALQVLPPEITADQLAVLDMDLVRQLWEEQIATAGGAAEANSPSHEPLPLFDGAA